HWADTSLLEFIDYLLEWSRDHPLFVLALARRDLAERRPAFVAGGRSATTLSLEPLPAKAMEAMLGGLVPGLPAELRARILERAQGVPLYAVETVRMLLDRGLLTREGELYRPTGEIDTLAVPETLQALVAARLDGLAARPEGAAPARRAPPRAHLGTGRAGGRGGRGGALPRRVPSGARRTRCGRDPREGRFAARPGRRARCVARRRRGGGALLRAG